jgi:hypothetical protein
MWFLLGLVADTRLVSLAARLLPTPLLGVFGSPVEADSPRMEPALSSAHARTPETQHVLRDESLVAVLKMLESSGNFTVVAELMDEAGADNAVRLRQYTFAHLDEASAFLADVANSFVFLGCELRPA